MIKTFMQKYLERKGRSQKQFCFDIGKSILGMGRRKSEEERAG